MLVGGAPRESIGSPSAVTSTPKRKRLRRRETRPRNGKRHYSHSGEAALSLKEMAVQRVLQMRRTQATGGPPSRVVARFRRASCSGSIHQGDALAFLRTLPDESADLVFLDPPFNLGKRYSRSSPTRDSAPEAAYRQQLEDVLAECARILKRGGTLYLYHLPLWASRLSVSLEAFLDFRQWIAIAMKNGLPPSTRLYPAHYALLCFAKGTPNTFSKVRLRPARCRHCGEPIKDYGGYWDLVARKGLNLSDFWEDLSPVRHPSRKHRAANELPPVLFERVFRMSGRRGGVFVDPYAGSGGSVIEAVRAGMQFRACDIVATYCTLLRRRLLAQLRQARRLQ